MRFVRAGRTGPSLPSDWAAGGSCVTVVGSGVPVLSGVAGSEPPPVLPVGVGSGSAVLPLPPPVGVGVSPPLPLPSPLSSLGDGAGSVGGVGVAGVGGVSGSTGSGGSALSAPPLPQPLPLPVAVPVAVPVAGRRGRRRRRCGCACGCGWAFWTILENDARALSGPLVLLGLGTGDMAPDPGEQHECDRAEDRERSECAGNERPRLVTQGVEGGHVYLFGTVMRGLEGFFAPHSNFRRDASELRKSAQVPTRLSAQIRLGVWVRGQWFGPEPLGSGSPR